jgi:hypothetical protein
MTLLGLTNEKTLYNWKSQPAKAKLTRDLLERTSYILGIYKSLEMLTARPEAGRSVGSLLPTTIRCSTARRRLDRLLAGQVVDLAGGQGLPRCGAGWLVIDIAALPHSRRRCTRSFV